MAETMSLCVSCKGCKRECPIGVDMARMKIEFLHHYRRRHGLGVRDRLFAYLPHYAPWAVRVARLLNLRDALPGAAALSERLLGLSARRRLPAWRRDTFNKDRSPLAGNTASKPQVVLFVDTFNNYFEPDNARAAMAVLTAAGYRVHLPAPTDSRPLCCGRTFLGAGLVSKARAEAQRMIEALRPYFQNQVPIIGLEPSCLLTMRDELKVLLPGDDSNALAAQAQLLEEFLAAESDSGRLGLTLKPARWRRALLHGHCHQKAFGVMAAVERSLRLVPQLQVQTIESSCCGMAGAFGYEAEHFDLSLRMAELNLLPAVRAAGDDTVVVADGTSCRHQIRDGAGREALHVARLLESCL
jgi:Fe-S oxidoreductase